MQFHVSEGKYVSSLISTYKGAFQNTAHTDKKNLTMKDTI